MKAAAIAALPAGSNGASKRHNSGDGLALIVTATGARSWSCRVTVEGQRRSFGLGAWPGVSEQAARDAMAAKCDELGVTPRSARPPRPAPATMVPVRRPPAVPAPSPAAPTGGTFGDYAARLATYKYATSKRERDAATWGSFVRSYCAPLWAVPVAECTALRILDDAAEPALEGGPRRICNGVEVPTLRGGTSRPWKVLVVVAEVLQGAVLDGTIAHNPAEGPTIRVGLKQRLCAHRPEPYDAPEVAAVPAIAAALRALHRPASAAVLLALLTASRRSEARNAAWDEFDRAAGVWTIPADRMKTGSPHRVPLSRQAAAVVAGQRVRAAAVDSPHVFPSGRRPAAVSEDAMRYARRAVAPDITIQGLRVAFRCWAADTGVPHEVAEACISHKFGSAVVRAYQHSDLLERRRPVLQAWADFVLPDG